jgi:methionyl-tRNA synthetase
MPRFYVTTPIYYVNDVPHIGHAYTTIAADVAARWRRLRGDPVRLLTGTDEHGQKVLRAAEKLGRTPQDHVDLLVERFKQLWVRLDVQYDDFIRTTEARHRDVVRGFLAQLYEQGELYSAPYAGWYSTSAERFWSPEEVAAATGCSVEDLASGAVAGTCPDSGQPVEWLVETNWFFRMSAYQERLRAWIAEHPGCIRPASRRNEVLGFLDKPLADLCISRPRARLPWGIPLPFAEDYVTYVWFDALTNYVSALGPERETWWPADVHLVGKDILTFHTVYWFSMLMALGLEPPRCVYAHGWWTNRSAKISKSVGNVIDPHALVDAYGADAVRYFLLREMPFGADGDFSDEAMLGRYNADLANDLGNLAHRALSMAEKWLGGVLPAVEPDTEGDAAFLATGATACAEFAAAMDDLQYRDALEALWVFVRAGNKYVDTEAPWARAKAGDVARVGQVLRRAIECVRIAASHLCCVCPGKGSELLRKLGALAPDLGVRWDVLPAGAKVAAGEPLFPRLEAVDGVVRRAEAAAGKGSPPTQGRLLQVSKEAKVAEETTGATTGATTGVAMVEYADFNKLALRVAKVVAAEKHPNADRLLVLTVDVGEERPRTIVAGIAAVYKPEDLVGQRIVVVANLAPAKLRGVESQGMLLAAGGPTVASLLTTISDVPPGTIVK